MDDRLVIGLLWYVVFVASTTLHEAAHAFIGWKLGDWTAFHAGQVSLNPMAHIKREPIGMVVIPWVTFASMGWMMGWASTPYDPAWAERNPVRAALKTLAGPAANLLLVIAAGLLIQVGLVTQFFSPPASVGFSQIVMAGSDGFPQALAVLISIIFSLNLVLFIFNMIPITPLDGQAWMNLLLKGDLNFRYRMLMMHPSLRLMGIFIAWFLMGLIFRPILMLAINVVYIFHGVHYG